LRFRLRFALVTALLLSVVTKAASAQERKHHLGASGGVSVLAIDDKSTKSVGAGGGLHYAYGLTDAWNFMAEATSSIVALDEKLETKDTPRTRPAGVDTVGLGMGYTIDVMRWVPYIGVLASGAVLSGGTLDRPLAVGGLQLAAGLDYMLTPNLGVGFAFRQHMMLTKLSTYTAYTNFFLRVELVWGK
jgi:hypothetical protein